MSDESSPAPNVSVVIPAYNTARYLQAAVESVIAQTFQAWELVIVDDGSTDETGAIADRIAAADGRIRAVHQPNAGLSQARNTGMREASLESEFILFLDADDMLCADALEFMIARLESQPEVAGIYGLPMAVDQDGRQVTPDIKAAFGYRRQGLARGRMVDWPEDRLTGVEVLAVWTCIETAGQVLLRRAALKDLWFDPEVDSSKTGRSEDWDYWFRLSFRGGLIHASRFVLRKRVHQTSITHTWKRTGRAAPVMRRNWLALPEATPAICRIMQQGHRESAFLRFEWAKSSLRRGDLKGAARQLATFILEYSRYLEMRHEYTTAFASVRQAAHASMAR